jgi:hypothetical protein
MHKQIALFGIMIVLLWTVNGIGYANPSSVNSAPQASSSAKTSVVKTTKTRKTSSFGELAEQAMGPLGAIAHFVQALCIIAGIGLFFGSFLQFSAHRKNSASVRLSQPVMLLLSGLGLLFIGFLSHL